MRVVAAMSGGVDSSVAAALLVDAGHDVIGLSMQLYDVSGIETGRPAFGSCCSLDDLHDARRVASALHIPHYTVNLERRFGEQVVSDFVREYVEGRTPIPCAHCNSDLKFTALLDQAHGLGAHIVATGHYAQIERDRQGRYVLRRGADPRKDQSYFLFSLTQEQLAHALFPVGDRPKDAVRQYARERGLPVSEKRESQEICFIPDHDYAGFIARHAPEDVHEGSIVDEQGRVLGRHDGIHHYTVGQRKGLGIASPAAGSPLYVLALRPASRQVVVGPKASLERTTLTTSRVNWIVEPPVDAVALQVQIRYRHEASAAVVRTLPDTRASIVFSKPQIAITPGQAAVFYDGDVVVGGGWID
jgi:tRNA-uridine 2-sulfurtransferase